MTALTVRQAAEAASARLGRKVDARFASRLLDGDQFVYRAALDEDPEAASQVLGFASGRLRLAEPGDVTVGRWAHIRYHKRQHLVVAVGEGGALLRARFACGVAALAPAIWHDPPPPHLPRCGQCARSKAAHEPRVVVEDVPPGQGDQQTEAYRQLAEHAYGRSVPVRSMRVER